MQRVTHDRPWKLFDTAATRRVEQDAAASLPPHTLMQRAGLSTARLALALAPHARTVWIACGPGNNGGDGLEAAAQLQQLGKQTVVTWLGDAAKAPADALAALGRARDAGVAFAASAPETFELAVDGLLGLGAKRLLAGALAGAASRLQACSVPVLAIDLPSGLDADTGENAAVRATHTLSLLTLKPGLFTAGGRDACGAVWFDDLGVAAPDAPSAWLAGPPPGSTRAHASHKGSFGDVAVIGGAAGMTGAALLAASAALHAGAGRVFAGLLDAGGLSVDVLQPELMFRAWASLDLRAMHVVCGCGGGDAVREVLPAAMATARSLVLDADALNAIAADTQLQTLLTTRSQRTHAGTVLTPHPLEAARLLGSSAAAVQQNRLAAARALTERFRCVVVLKGSGTVVGAPGRPPHINPTGNARLATAGTGDVLAGVVGARLAAGAWAFDAATAAVWAHGKAADDWPSDQPLTASELARRHLY